jgi:hypothetical protein
MSSFSMIRRVVLAGLLAVGAAGPALASDGSDTSEETAPAETRPEAAAPAPTTSVVVVLPPSQQAEINAARARCDEATDRADFLSRTGGPVQKGGEVDRLRAQAFACQAEIDAALLAAATTPTHTVVLPQ